MPSMRVRQQLQQEAYSDRDESLMLLGFKSYSAYLRSRLWKIVRERSLECNGRICRSCGKPATQAHHADYSRAVLSGEDVRGLVPVCGSCHKHGSVTLRNTKARKIDRLRVKHLHDTNEWLAKRLPPRDRRVAWCECGQRRKKNHALCGACASQRRKGKTPRRKLTVEEIRARALEYAFL